MSRQLPLALPAAGAALAREDFLAAPGNAAALAALEDWPRWPVGRMALAGPEGAGKTHLLTVWAEARGAALLSAGGPEGAERIAAADVPRLASGGAVALDDAAGVAGHAEAERALLHLANALSEAGGHLLVASREAPARWGLELPDLASRLAAAPVARIAPPDDALLAAVVVKLFADRQLRIAPAALEAILARIERSGAAARDAVALLDAAALAHGRAITPQLVRAVLSASPEETGAAPENPT